MTNPFADAEPIDCLSRADLLEAGQLVAANTELLKNAGIRYPVAYTAAVYVDCIEWTDRDTENTGMPQDSVGREWDVLWMLALVARRSPGDRISFRLNRVPRDTAGSPADAEEVVLHAGLAPGDRGEPVITVVSEPSEF